MYMIPGLSYGHYTGSLAYPRDFRTRAPKVHMPTAIAILDMVHPGQFHTLPPSPNAIAYRGSMMGVIKYGELWR